MNKRIQAKRKKQKKSTSKLTRGQYKAIRKFRKRMIKFQQAARIVKGFHEGETDIELLGKAVDSLFDDVNQVKKQQDELLKLVKKF